MAALGNFKKLEMEKIDVYLVEDHNEALNGIYREIGRKRLPMSGCTLLHFDSHSDLSIPKNLRVEDVFKKESLFSILSIENWIIPAVFAGHIDTVIWVKPMWTEESFESFSTFKVGYHTKSEEIRVTSTSNYFVSELSYAPEVEMSDCKTLNLFVIPFPSEDNLTDDVKSKPCSAHISPTNDFNCQSSGLDSNTADQKRKSTDDESFVENLLITNSSKLCGRPSDVENCRTTTDLSSHSLSQSTLHNQISRILESKADGFILDIDLDFFSTTNPIHTVLTPNQQDLIKSLYQYVPPKDNRRKSISACLTARHEQISYLKSVMKAAQNGDKLELGNSQRDQWLSELISSLKHCALPLGELDFDWLHEIGTGIDDCELPHHISSTQEISSLLNSVEAVLRALPKPAVITIARSSDDDYCPPGQVDYIENGVLGMLHQIYTNLEIKIMYK